MNVVSISDIENLVSTPGVQRDDVIVGASSTDLGFGSRPLSELTQRVTVYVADGGIRFTLDGSTPSTSHGAVASQGMAMTMSRLQAQKFLAIRAGAQDAKLYVVEQVFAHR